MANLKFCTKFIDSMTELGYVMFKLEGSPIVYTVRYSEVGLHVKSANDEFYCGILDIQEMEMTMGLEILDNKAAEILYGCKET